MAQAAACISVSTAMATSWQDSLAEFLDDNYSDKESRQTAERPECKRRAAFDLELLLVARKSVQAEKAADSIADHGTAQQL